MIRCFVIIPKKTSNELQLYIPEANEGVEKKHG